MRIGYRDEQTKSKPTVKQIFVNDAPPFHTSDAIRPGRYVCGSGIPFHTGMTDTETLDMTVRDKNRSETHVLRIDTIVKQIIGKDAPVFDA